MAAIKPRSAEQALAVAEWLAAGGANAVRADLPMLRGRPETRQLLGAVVQPSEPACREHRAGIRPREL